MSQQTEDEFLGLFLLDEKNVKDIKFSAAGFATMVVILTHYAWIMRQWVLNPNLPKETLILYFSLFAVTVVASITVLVKKVYPIVYADDLKEQASTEKKEQ